MSQLALITGASRGIGHAIAHYFAQQGYSLILVAKNSTRLTQVQTEFKTRYPNLTVDTLALDFSQPESVTQPLNALLETLPSIDVMVSSAGVLTAGSTLLNTTNLTELFNINVVSTMVVCNLVAEKMKQQGHGEIYTLGSMAALEPVTKIAAYSASKAALVTYSQMLYQELLPFNVRVCCLCPSVVDTDMTNDGRIANNLKIDPQDLRNAIDFVRQLSPAASMSVLPIRCKVIDLEKQKA